MSKKNVSYSAIEHNAFFLSVFIHVIIANLFIFSVATQSVSFKPEFVFWGSFLDSIEDVLHDKGTVRPLPVLGSTDIQNPEAPRSLQLEKPKANYQKTDDSQKDYTKNTFLKKAPAPQTLKEGSSIGNLNETKAHYIPLKIQPIFEP